MKRHFWLAFWAGLLPILVVNIVFTINIQQGLNACFPYWEGCMSVSRGMRSGPGLLLFKLQAPVSAALMWMTWRSLPQWPWSHPSLSTQLWWLSRLGMAGSLFFVVYALWLGTDGEIYRWLRRYGVVFYFSMTGLAHLLLWAKISRYETKKLPAQHVYGVVVILTWVTGIGSAFKRKLIDDPLFLDRVENALEWNFALFLSLAFVALAFVRRSLERQPDNSSQTSVSGQK